MTAPHVHSEAESNAERDRKWGFTAQSPVDRCPKARNVTFARHLLVSIRYNKAHLRFFRIYESERAERSNLVSITSTRYPYPWMLIVCEPATAARALQPDRLDNRSSRLSKRPHSRVHTLIWKRLKEKQRGRAHEGLRSKGCVRPSLMARTGAKTG